jgi:hypothetical protein
VLLKSAEIDRRLGAAKQDAVLIERPNYDIRLRVCEGGPCQATANKESDAMLHIRKGSGSITITAGATSWVRRYDSSSANGHTN